MRPFVVLLSILAVISVSGVPKGDDGSYDLLKKQAEQSYGEKSFGRAHELYERAAKLAGAADRRWVEMRLADTAWRAAAANPSADTTVPDAARQSLEALIRDAGEEADRVTAEAEESLGDFFLQREDRAAAQSHYQEALEWWSGSPDLPLARRRYLDIVYRLAEPGRYAWMAEGVDLSMLSRDVLANAVSIADSPEDRAHTRFLFGKKLLEEGRPLSVERGLEVLGEVIAEGRSLEWYDDALIVSADRFAHGVPTTDDDGTITWTADYTRALALYRRLLDEFKRGETPYYDRARTAADAIVRPDVNPMVGQTFLPSSEQQFGFAWRNVKEVTFTITPVDIIDDALATGQNLPDLLKFRTGRAPARRWTFATNDKGDHVPGQQMIRIKPRLEPGAYVIEASSGTTTAKQRLLVTDANIVAHSSLNRADLFVCSAITGEPLPGARIRIWQRKSDGTSAVIDLRSDSSGMATLPLAGTGSNSLVIGAVTANNRPAVLTTWGYFGYGTARGQSRIYAFTDRPAYRPGESVHWKVIARNRIADEWVTPAGETIEYEIDSPRGEKVASGTATLNEFGSFWADLPLTESMPLGAYSISFRKATDRQQRIGQAQLFRLEEYKLPEFRVSVKTPEENGRKKVFRSGDSIEAVIEATYYFGGPVANAEVEVTWSRRDFVHQWHPWLRYDWYYDDAPPQWRGRRGAGESSTLRTDADGHAVLRIETSPDDADAEYEIEARVTDASRREVTGSGRVRVSKQSYSVVAHPTHYLHSPGDKVTVDFKALDANDQPVQVTGTVKVIRRVWDEVWIDPLGHQVDGAKLDRLRDESIVFPPPSTPPWTRKFAGYREEEVLATQAATDGEGEATVTFTPPRDGYYAVRWTSLDRRGQSKVQARDVVAAETAVWVSDRSVREIGYHAGGIEIVVDKESFRSGGVAPVMIATPASGAWVLMTTSADGILATQLLHLDGTVKLVQLPLDDRNTPAFFITASSVRNAALSTATARVVVPPVAHFIDVGVTTDRDEYRPRSEGTVTVTTRDVDGKPVRAEIALALSDEAVTAIQTDPAGDPRRFFFETRRGTTVQAAASVQSERYVRLVEEDGKLIDERQRVPGRADQANAKDESGVAQGVVGGVVGGVVDAMRNAPPPAPPPAPQAALMAKSAMAEAITVTAESPAVENAIDVVVRNDFRSTAFWQPDVVTGADGRATVKVSYPDALTTWRATARAVSSSTQVGMGSTTSRTSMPMLVRLEGPRFFVAGDRATVSAVVNNNTDAALSVRPSIAVEGLTLATEANAPIMVVPPHGESRADWIVTAAQAGPAKLRVSGVAAAKSLSDAMEKPFTVYEHGIDKLVARSGKLRGEEALIRLDLPAARRATSLTVQLQPSLATTMLDALPYLIEFPYGCTEQTMSRFLPAAVVARTLAQNGLSRSDIEGRMFGGIERSSVSRTHPGQTPSLGRLDEVIARSRARLLDFQHGDGGWGWWKQGDSDPFMTAYVVWGFAVLRGSEYKVPESSVNRAMQYLDTELVKYDRDPSTQAWILHAIAAWRGADGTRIADLERRAFDNAFDKRQRLTAYSRALLALAAHDFHDAERAAILVRNLEDGVKVDRSPDRSVLVRGSGAGADESMATAHWGEDRFWWRWYDGPVESTSFALQALMAIDPKNALVEPAMNWLVKNRRGAQWNNTRDSAVAILALDEYLRASGELASDVSYELSVNGRPVATRHFAPSEILSAPASFTIDPALVRDSNEIRIRRTGGGTLYFAISGRFVSLEEPVKAAGNEIFVRRDYYRLAPHQTLLKGAVYDRELMTDGASLNGGERVEVVVTMETKNDYDYLMLEDLKPAGLEAVSIISGEPLSAQELTSKSVARKFGPEQPPDEKPSVVRQTARTTTGRSTYVYQELRDRKVAMFVDHLPQGVWEIRYMLRAETPGSFHALPLMGQAMYVPEIHANSDEVRMVVK